MAPDLYKRPIAWQYASCPSKPHDRRCPGGVSAFRHWDPPICIPTNACTSNSIDRFFGLKYGKPIIAEVLSNEVSLCGDSVAVCGKDSLILRFYASRRIILVSGPQSLIDDVRGTLRKPNVAGPMTVLRGGPSVFLHVEHFGM